MSIGLISYSIPATQFCSITTFTIQTVFHLHLVLSPLSGVSGLRFVSNFHAWWRNAAQEKQKTEKCQIQPNGPRYGQRMMVRTGEYGMGIWPRYMLQKRTRVRTIILLNLKKNRFSTLSQKTNWVRTIRVHKKRCLILKKSRLVLHEVLTGKSPTAYLQRKKTYRYYLNKKVIFPLKA